MTVALSHRNIHKLDRFKVHQTASCQWIAEKQNILISGPTGTGKTYLSCAFGHTACRNGYSTRYFRLNKLLNEIYIAKSIGTYPKLMTSLGKCKLLIIDDFGLNQLNNLEARELLEIIENRYLIGSNIIASQLPIAKWYETINDPTMADAIIDRIIHNSVIFQLEGDTMRTHKQ